MFVSKIKLENFKIYFERQMLLFEKEGKKNVFVISGNNGFGKTTLLNSLIWCLYGKLMVDVDDKFRREVYEAGGYKKFASNNINKRARMNGVDYYLVSVTITDVFIPSIPCKEVEIIREFNIEKSEDSIKILIDGMENELTREVGPEIFINDFILPKEVAKFFFFDAEKIVSLAEMKSLEDKKNVSKAYSEVLGIKKYEDLKTNLEDMRIRLKRNWASDKDKEKLTELQKDISQSRDLIQEYQSQIEILQEEKSSKKQASEKYQEKLIREGNSISVSELSDLNKLKNRLINESDYIRSKFKELLELTPFAIAANKFIEVHEQLLHESEVSSHTMKPVVLKRKAKKIRVEFEKKIKGLKINRKTFRELSRLVEELVVNNFGRKKVNDDFKVLLDLSETEKNEYEAIYNNLKVSFNSNFKKLVSDLKNNRIALNKVVRKISNAETKENDLLVKEIRQQKDQLDRRIENIDKKIIELSQEIGGIQKDISIKAKVTSELTKKIELDELDLIKDETAIRLIEELDDFIIKLKTEKKYSLEIKMKNELNKLMHKTGFIEKVEIEISSDYLDIHLYDKNGSDIDKEMLSKGEQQLYATALLKSLVDESNISFPVFIDSPLQKFDKKHSRNIICEFYPKISEQVVLFPLLEKELTENEYNILLPTVNKVFLIDNVEEYCSRFVELESELLFSNFEGRTKNVYAH